MVICAPYVVSTPLSPKLYSPLHLGIHPSTEIAFIKVTQQTPSLHIQRSVLTHLTRYSAAFDILSRGSPAPTLSWFSFFPQWGRHLPFPTFQLQWPRAQSPVSTFSSWSTSISYVPLIHSSHFKCHLCTQAILYYFRLCSAFSSCL